MRTINLNGYIDEEVWYGDEITPAMLHDALYGENGEFSDDVRIILNSYGGKEAIKTYESIRNIVFTGDLYRILSPYEGNRTSMMYVLPDKSRAVFYAYQLKSHIGEVSAPMRFKGLSPDKKYNVKELNIYPGSRAATGSANGQSFSGDFLMNQGLPIGLSGDYSSAVIELEQQ